MVYLYWPREKRPSLVCRIAKRKEKHFFHQSSFFNLCRQHNQSSPISSNLFKCNKKQQKRECPFLCSYANARLCPQFYKTDPGHLPFDWSADLQKTLEYFRAITLTLQIYALWFGPHPDLPYSLASTCFVCDSFDVIR